MTALRCYKSFLVLQTFSHLYQPSKAIKPTLVGTVLERLPEGLEVQKVTESRHQVGNADWWHVSQRGLQARPVFIEFLDALLAYLPQRKHQLSRVLPETRGGLKRPQWSGYLVRTQPEQVGEDSGFRILARYCSDFKVHPRRINVLRGKAYDRRVGLLQMISNCLKP